MLENSDFKTPVPIVGHQSMQFNSSDPYPLCNEEVVFDLNARAHAEAADRWLGFRIDDTENKIKLSEKISGQETWVDTDPQVFLTPYIELRYILELLNPEQHHWTIVDCGAAYCRLAFVMHACYPSLKFRGVEFVSERVKEARRLFGLHQLTNALVENADLMNFEIPSAEVYFIYDFGSRADINIFIKKLEALKSQGAHFKIVARGLRTRDTIESYYRNWLFKEGPISRLSEFSIYTTH